jgi:two-component system, cell cycle response regulator
VRNTTRDLWLGVLTGLLPPTGALIYVVERHNRALRRLSSRLQALSVTDALTGLPNRRSFDEKLAVEVSRANRYRTPLALVMIDVDQFKSINDQHGHVSGDQALCRVAAVLEREKRVGDLIARLGGDEFVALLPHTDALAAFAWSERVRRRIADAPLLVHGGAVRIQASFGVAESKQPGESAARLIERADQALYTAKRSGRNQVAVGAV